MPASTLARFGRITPQQLRAFEATARLLSVTKAAQELYVSQPTVSVQLRELSATTGQRLFETRGRQIRLTQAGEELYKTVQEVAACWQRFEARIAEINGLVSGRLRIAAVTTAEYFVPDLLGPFSAAHQGVEIELAIENRDRVVGRLMQGVDDLAVMMMPPEHIPLERLAFQDNPLVIIAPARHPLASQQVQLADLAQERWLMREPGSGTRMAAEQYFSAHNFKPNVVMSLGSNEAIKHAVAAELGIAVLSQLAIPQVLSPSAASGVAALAADIHQTNLATPDLSGLRILQVSGFPIIRHWSVVWRKDQPMSATARHFLDYLRSTESLQQAEQR
ncbi:LysR family transcriptional regulator [Rheinheimera sp.]|uniref:LysR family transcriptional regulator n=1 Tax=Rheinheimera sp. TaxID=1869214 RepID=UPI002FDD2B83